MTLQEIITPLLYRTVSLMCVYSNYFQSNAVVFGMMCHIWLCNGDPIFAQKCGYTHLPYIIALVLSAIMAMGYVCFEIFNCGIWWALFMTA